MIQPEPHLALRDRAPAESTGTPRVLFVNPWERFIGPNRYLIELLRPLPELARASTIVFHEKTDAMEEYRELGCELEIWPEVALVHPRPNLPNLLSLAWRHSAGLIKLVARLRRLKPSVVVTNTENVWVAGLGAKISGIPHLQVFHALTLDYRFGPRSALVRLYLKILGGWNARMVAVSDAVRSFLQARDVPDAKLAVIPNPIAADKVIRHKEDRLPENLEAMLSGRSPLLACAGQLSPMKGQDVLVRVMPSILERYPGALCVFVGKRGSSAGMDDTRAFEAKLLKSVRILGIENHVAFVEGGAWLPALLGRADVNVQPSRTESFSRLVAEALLCGTRVVAFDVGGIREAGGDQAVYVPAGDEQGLARAILKVLANNPNEPGEPEVTGKRIRERYDAPIVAKLFTDLLAETSRPREEV